MLNRVPNGPRVKNGNSRTARRACTTRQWQTSDTDSKKLDVRIEFPLQKKRLSQSRWLRRFFVALFQFETRRNQLSGGLISEDLRRPESELFSGSAAALSRPNPIPESLPRQVPAGGPER